MMVSAFARAGIWFDDPKLVARAEKGARFTLDRLKRAHVWRGGNLGGEATLNDLAFAAMAFWDLFEATGKEEYLNAAKRYVDSAKESLAAGDGGYYLVKKTDDLIARPRVTEDNPLPSSAAVLARVDWRLAAALGKKERAAEAAKTARHLLGMLGGANLFSGEAMNLYKETSVKQVEVVYAFKPGEINKMKWLSRGAARQWGVVRIPLGAGSVNPILVEGRHPASETTAYVCLENICLAPSKSPDEVKSRLQEMMKTRTAGRDRS
jgi:uncharacterized protein YyaL (SSP411 family)